MIFRRMVNPLRWKSESFEAVLLKLNDTRGRLDLASSDMMNLET
jgi:hypothetical protein